MSKNSIKITPPTCMRFTATACSILQLFLIIQLHTLSDCLTLLSIYSDVSTLLSIFSS